MPTEPIKKDACVREGDPVTWIYETRGGWGYTFHVPAYVVKFAVKRVGIAALWADGETWVPRWNRSTARACVSGQQRV